MCNGALPTGAFFFSLLAVVWKSPVAGDSLLVDSVTLKINKGFTLPRRPPSPPAPPPPPPLPPPPPPLPPPIPPPPPPPPPHFPPPRFSPPPRGSSPLFRSLSLSCFLPPCPRNVDSGGRPVVQIIAAGHHVILSSDDVMLEVRCSQNPKIYTRLQSTWRWHCLTRKYFSFLAKI